MTEHGTNPRCERNDMSEKKSSDFDGIYFLPGDEEGELVLSFFDFKEEMAGGKPIKVSDIGHMYHIAFFKRDEDGKPKFDDAFEAILADPATWIGNLAGAGVYGCAIRKTEKSSDWFDDYLQRTVGYVKIRELIGSLKSILETK
jgi:hypothetical protein